MTLEAWYDPEDRKREERFFRNLCGYLEDNAAGGEGMMNGASIPQMALFSWEGGVMLCEPSASTTCCQKCARLVLMLE